jgi:outer membrane protein OmpA-like peptidoglycan-associated protein
MPHLSLPFLAAGLCLPLFCHSALALSSACQPLLEAFDQALNSKRLAAIVTAADRTKDAAECSGGERRRVARLTALAHGEESSRLAKTGQGLDKQLQALEAGARYAQPWQLMAAIGDLKQEVKDPDGQIDYGGASLAYQSALVDLDEVRSAGQQIPRDAVERIEKLASQTRSLAPTFTSGRDLLDRDPRNIVVEKIPIPIQFKYDSDEMTDLGEKYATELLEVLKAQNMPSIRLVGHTDPKGSDEYNDALSKRRAAAVKAYLAKRGYPSDKIATDGSGKRAPLQIEDAKQYTVEQIYQMMRRVELKRL